jgi:AbrB family looped-hinge helix DNA binding protein
MLSPARPRAAPLASYVWEDRKVWQNRQMAHNGSEAPGARYTLQLGARGRVVLPAAVRRRLDLHPGERLVLAVEPDGTMRLTPLRHQVEALQGAYRHLAPGQNLADQLIAERRREAARD